MNKWRSVLYYGGLLLLLAAAAGSGVLLAEKWVNRSGHSDQQESLEALLQEYMPGIPASGETKNPAYPDGGSARDTGMTPEELLLLRQQRLAACERLRQENADLVGWLSIEGTPINYPVVQSLSEPDFYLKHNFNKKKSSYGTLYVAETCDVALPSDNLIIYGHHMKDGSMFAGLMKYMDQTYMEQHPVIQFDTFGRIGDYRIIGAFKATANLEETDFYNAAHADTPEAFTAYVSEIKKRSFYDTGETAVFGDQLITLVTCEYTIDEGRMFVVAKLVSE